MKKLLPKINAALHQRFSNFLDKKSATHARKGNSFENQQLPKELLQPIIRRFEKHKI